MDRITNFILTDVIKKIIERNMSTESIHCREGEQICGQEKTALRIVRLLNKYCRLKTSANIRKLEQE